jgi:hypothetical protein
MPFSVALTQPYPTNCKIPQEGNKMAKVLTVSAQNKILEQWRAERRKHVQDMAATAIDDIRSGTLLALEAAMEGSGAEEFPTTPSAVLDIIQDQVEYSRHSLPVYTIEEVREIVTDVADEVFVNFVQESNSINSQQLATVLYGTASTLAAKANSIAQ